MYKLLLALLLIIGSVQALTPTEWDLATYPDDPVEPKREEFNVKVIFYDTPEQINAAWKIFNENDPVKARGTIRAFALVNKNHRTCYVNLIKAKSWNDMESMAVLGHEMYHCMLADHGRPIAIDPSEDK